MALSSEVQAFLDHQNLVAIQPSEAEALARKIYLPLSLEPMSSHDHEAPTIDIDSWNRNSELALQAAHASLANGHYYLFISASPRNFLLAVEKATLLTLIFGTNFHFSFAVFSADLADYLLEDHSGLMVASGMFTPLVEAAT